MVALAEGVIENKEKLTTFFKEQKWEFSEHDWFTDKYCSHCYG